MTKIAQITPTRVVIGVDTHKDLHVAVALDGLGRRVDATSVPTTAAGYRQLLAWAESHGEVEAFGVEGTGSYGAGLARHLRGTGHQVIEVVRPNRQARRRNGKSDPADAEAAARAVLSGEANGRPKSGDDLVEPPWVSWRLHALEARMESWQRSRERRAPLNGATAPPRRSKRSAWSVN